VCDHRVLELVDLGLALVEGGAAQAQGGETLALEHALDLAVEILLCSGGRQIGNDCIHGGLLRQLRRAGRRTPFIERPSELKQKGADAPAR